MLEDFDVLILAMENVNLLFHSVGFFILVYLYRLGERTTQHLFVINIALVEALYNFVLMLAGYFYYSSKYSLYVTQYYLYVISDTMLFFYYVGMFYIVADQFCAIWLNIRYKIYWSIRKTLILLVATWIVMVAIVTTFCLLHHFYDFSYFPYHLYIYLIFDFVAITTGVPIYMFMYKKHEKVSGLKHVSIVRSKPKSRVAGQHTETTDQDDNSFQVLRQSNLCLTCALGATFLLFFVIPDAIYTTHTVMHSEEEHSHVLKNVCNGFFALSDFSHALIYIFSQKKIQKLICLCCHCCCRLKLRNDDVHRDSVTLLTYTDDDSLEKKNDDGINAMSKF